MTKLIELNSPLYLRRLREAINSSTSGAYYFNGYHVRRVMRVKVSHGKMFVKDVRPMCSDCFLEVKDGTVFTDGNGQEIVASRS